MTIDWKKVAREYELSPNEFEQEIFKYAAVLGTMRIDADGGKMGDALSVMLTDNVGSIEVSVRRLITGGE